MKIEIVKQRRMKSVCYRLYPKPAEGDVNFSATSELLL